MLVGYCTNVHAGNDLPAIRRGLTEHAVPVRRRLCTPDLLPVGLWFPHTATIELTDPAEVAGLRDWLHEHGLQAYTVNGFPYGDFHQARVKHAVYRPAWFESARMEYTLRLIDILADLLPPGAAGSISTLPVAWGQPRPTEERWRAAAHHLNSVAHRLQRLYDQRGIRIALCLEPEPGCALQRSSDVVTFLQEYVYPGGDESLLRRTIQVCHDICHSAVVYESQQAAWAAYAAAGIVVGKVQISSALRVEMGDARSDRAAVLQLLRQFAEDRYLHQTTVRAHGRQAFWEDLPDALAVAPLWGREWRVHFHVPIHLAEIGRLATTQEDIRSFFSLLRSVPPDAWPHLEVETYAWNVLPAGLATPDLTTGLTAELRWAQDMLHHNAQASK